MQIVIELSQERYNLLQTLAKQGVGSMPEEWSAILNGTPLPKGHGRLIDADALKDKLDCSDRDIYVKATLDEDAPTVIGADGGVE